MDHPNFSSSDSGYDSISLLSSSAAPSSSNLLIDNNAEASSLSRQTDDNPDRASRSLSISHSSVIGSGSNARSRYAAEPCPSDVHQDRSRLPTSHGFPISIKSTRAFLNKPRKRSKTLGSSSDNSISRDFSDPKVDANPLETPRSHPVLDYRNPSPALPEPSIKTKTSLTDSISRRFSNTSLYSLASARGILSSHPTDPIVSVRTGHTKMSSNGKRNSGQSDVSLTNPSTAPAFPAQAPQTNSGQASQSATARDGQSQPLDLIGRQRTDPNNRPQQPDRSRSRAKRRFSGSTATSSHSPSSERHREREECRSRPPFRIWLPMTATN